MLTEGQLCVLCCVSNLHCTVYYSSWLKWIKICKKVLQKIHHVACNRGLGYVQGSLTPALTCMRQSKQPFKKKLSLRLRGLDSGSLHRRDPNRSLHHRRRTVRPTEASATDAGNRKKRYKQMKEHLVGRHVVVDDQSQHVRCDLRLCVKTFFTHQRGINLMFQINRDGQYRNAVLTQASRGTDCKTD